MLRRNRYGKYFINFSPAISNEAGKSIREEIRSWNLHLRSDREMEDLSRMFNPQRALAEGRTAWLHGGNLGVGLLGPTHLVVLAKLIGTPELRVYRVTAGVEIPAGDEAGQVASGSNGSGKSCTG